MVRHIRSKGALKGIVSTTDLENDSLVKKALQSPGLVGRDLVREVMPSEPRSWSETLHPLNEVDVVASSSQGGPHIVCLDYGMKWNIPRHLANRGNRVTILPGSSTAEEVLRHNPDGVFLSNGPGDPEPLEYAIQTIRQLIGKKPIFGICLGHQLLSLACGAKTFKLKFGHRGANQPVQHLETGKVEVTSQNHGFAVEEQSLPTVWRLLIAISTTTRSLEFAISPPKRSRCNTTPKPQPALTIALTSSIASKPRFKPSNVA